MPHGNDRLPSALGIQKPHAARIFITALAALAITACATRTEPVDYAALAASLDVAACANETLTDFDELLLIVPHPDDEILGFAGLTDAFVRAGKPVKTMIVTDGDAYCTACTLWATGSTQGPPCNARQLSNFSTPAVDSLAEARRLESIEAARRIGAPEPEFLGYPDTGIAFARAFRDAGQPETPLARSDFSACTSCGDCGTGIAEGPLTDLSADSLTQTLEATLESTLESTMGAAGQRTLVATTHPLDGHPDHAALADFVLSANEGLEKPHTLAFAVIHAHTAKDQAFPDCWYPSPTAAACPCTDEPAYAQDPQLLQERRELRRRPDLPQQLPDDVDYGAPLQLCLGGAISEPDGGRKADAINAFQTQLGTTSLEPGVLPGSLVGIMDCSGYLASFGRQTEVFVLVPPAER